MAKFIKDEDDQWWRVANSGVRQRALTRFCEFCNTEFGYVSSNARNNPGRFCSRSCANKGYKPGRHLTGAAHPNWKGGRHIDMNGYCLIRMPEHPDSYSGGYILEHRYVMEQHVGRRLRINETVHHMNGDRLDNRIENLQLRQGKHGSGIALCCGDCGSSNIIPCELAN